MVRSAEGASRTMRPQPGIHPSRRRFAAPQDEEIGRVMLRKPQFSTLYPVAFTIGCQKAVSSASSFLRSSGVEPTGLSPIASSFCFTSGLASAAETAALSLDANSVELPAGNHIPYQLSATRSMPL